MSADPSRYSLDDLAELAGVSRRTIRYYIQERLLPAPLGVGRGSHYDQAHLDALLRVKSLQEAGLTLEGIQHALSGSRPEAPPVNTAPARSVWRRFALAPGVELHVRGDARVPPGRLLQELADWYRVHLEDAGDPNHGD